MKTLFLFDIISRLNLSQQLLMVAILFFAAFELFRFLKFGKKAGSTFGSLIAYAIVGLVFVAAMFLLGWADPHPGKFMSDVGTWGERALALAREFLSKQINI